MKFHSLEFIARNVSGDIQAKDSKNLIYNGNNSQKKYMHGWIGNVFFDKSETSFVQNLVYWRQNEPRANFAKPLFIKKQRYYLIAGKDNHVDGLQKKVIKLFIYFKKLNINFYFILANVQWK